MSARGNAGRRIVGSRQTPHESSSGPCPIWNPPLPRYAVRPRLRDRAALLEQVVARRRRRRPSPSCALRWADGMARSWRLLLLRGRRDPRPQRRWTTRGARRDPRTQVRLPFIALGAADAAPGRGQGGRRKPSRLDLSPAGRGIPRSTRPVSRSRGLGPRIYRTARGPGARARPRTPGQRSDRPDAVRMARRPGRAGAGQSARGGRALPSRSGSAGCTPTSAPRGPASPTAPESMVRPEAGALPAPLVPVWPPAATLPAPPERAPQPSSCRLASICARMGPSMCSTGMTAGCRPGWYGW